MHQQKLHEINLSILVLLCVVHCAPRYEYLLRFQGKLWLGLCNTLSLCFRFKTSTFCGLFLTAGVEKKLRGHNSFTAEVQWQQDRKSAAHCGSSFPINPQFKALSLSWNLNFLKPKFSAGRERKCPSRPTSDNFVHNCVIFFRFSKAKHRNEITEQVTELYISQHYLPQREQKFSAVLWTFRTRFTTRRNNENLHFVLQARRFVPDTSVAPRGVKRMANHTNFWHSHVSTNIQKTKF